MLFNSYQFMIFFPIVLLVFFVIPKKLRQVWLLITSLFFYACWNPKYLLLLLSSIVVTYLSAILMDKAEDKKKKAILIAGLLINFGILFFFKYYGFAIDSINSLITDEGKQLVDRFDVILPVGISFYTFQAVGYMIDAYRGDIKTEKNFIKYALFVSFFPQLVAGPIERSKNILSQIDDVTDKKLWDFDRVKSGFIYMMWGFFLKIVVADRIAVIVDEVFDRYYSYGTFILILGAVCFALQIYCDFASYSTIAIGSAKIMGFTLMENFETPYFAMSIKEFWRRWHISLSTWFRDYLYIPLGGSRCSKAKKYRNIMITFLVSGLWHGANWTFVIWGGLHGLYQVIGEMLTPVRNKVNEMCVANKESFSYKLSRVIGTFILADFAWIFFRAATLTEAFSYINRMFTKLDPWALTDGSIYTLGLDYGQMHILWASLIIMLIVSLIRYKKKIIISEAICSQGVIFQILVVYLLIMAIIVFGKYGPSEEMKAFLYFQF